MYHNEARDLLLAGQGLEESSDKKVAPEMAIVRRSSQSHQVRGVPRFANSFGLPAGVHMSCPGETDFCQGCYAKESENLRDQTHDLVNRNYAKLQIAETPLKMAILLTDMVARVDTQFKRRDIPAQRRIFRIHWDGDFYSEDYAEAWKLTMREFPGIRFLAYTRSFGSSWLNKGVDVVPILAEIENLSLYLSIDTENAIRAREVLKRYGDYVMRAYCGETLEQATLARDIAETDRSRMALYCPELDPSKKLQLVNADVLDPKGENNVGACIKCQACPKSTKDIYFVTSKQGRLGTEASKARLDAMSIPVMIATKNASVPDVSTNKTIEEHQYTNETHTSKIQLQRIQLAALYGQQLQKGDDKLDLDVLERRLKARGSALALQSFEGDA